MRKVLSVGLGKLIISVISILLLRVYSDNLTLSEIGLVTLLINFDSFFGLVYASPFGNYLSLTALSDIRNNSISQKIADYVGLTLLSSIFSFFIYIIYQSFFDFSFAITINLLFIGYLFLNNSTPIISSLLTVVNRTESSMLLQVVKSVSGFVSFLIIFSFTKGAAGWIIASFVGVLLPTLINFIVYKRSFYKGSISLFKFKGFINKELFFKYILPYAFMQLILWFFFNSYRIYAGKLFNLDFLGELGLAFTFASQFCSAFDSVITQIYQPDFYRLIDNVPEEKKMENFGVFLKEVLPVYLIFLVVGFFPYVVSFQLLLKPNFSVDTTLLLTAWIFNFIRISFNVFGLITQVKLNPKMVSKYVFWGVGLSAFIFSVMYAFNLPITRNSFLLIIGSIPVVVLIFFIHNIGKRLNQLSIISRFFLNLIICVLIYFLLIKLELSGIVVKNHQAIIVMIACLFLAILGIQMLVLPKKLKAL